MNITCVSDLRSRAKRRLPKPIFDFLDGGTGSEHGVRRNERAFDELLLKPRALVNVEDRDLSVNLFGSCWSAPFGIAPIGGGNFIWPRAEEAIARAAAASNIPYTLSTAATTKLERIAEVAPDHSWFQLYYIADLVDRAERAGYDVLVLTVDAPVAARRLREVRNGLNFPSRTTQIARELCVHPRWALETIRNGLPRFVNLEQYAPPVSKFDWEDLARLRERWRRHLVVKGLLTAEDCVRARSLGCDGVVISNHGGRQLDCAAATIEVLPEIRAAVGAEFPLIIDSGVRTGEHIVKALAAGADFVLVGRAMMYAVAAHGRGAAKALIDLLIDEASRCLGQIGYRDFGSLKQDSPLIGRAKTCS
jgi:isopentenyl diphosphate isomerase/L-lactate dehydrogenase-like FMN-dependent dehydrogenase